MVACAEELRHSLRILAGVGRNGGGEIATVGIGCIVLNSEATALIRYVGGRAMRKISLRFSMPIFLISVFCLLQIGCGGSDGDDGSTPRPAVITGNAILDLQVVDGGWNGTPPAPQAGYTSLNIDLNGGTGGHYIWLYYKVGKADGSEGEPVSKIYTVDEYDGETGQGGTKLPVNLNEGGPSIHEPLWLYYMKAGWPVARCIVVDRRSSGGANHVRMYAPPEAEGKYQVVWVEELKPDSLKTPYSEFPPNVQDLNEKESSLFYVSDYIYIGYCKD
jgi:hypothetical protein